MKQTHTKVVQPNVNFSLKLRKNFDKKKSYTKHITIKKGENKRKITRLLNSFLD